MIQLINIKISFGGNKMIILRPFSKIFNIVGQIMAFLTVIIIGLVFINDGWVQFLPDSALNTLKMIKEYAVLSTLLVVGFAFASRRNIIFFVIYCLLAVVAISFSFPALF